MTNLDYSVDFLEEIAIKDLFLRHNIKEGSLRKKPLNPYDSEFFELEINKTGQRYHFGEYEIIFSEVNNILYFYIIHPDQRDVNFGKIKFRIEANSLTVPKNIKNLYGNDLERIHLDAFVQKSDPTIRGNYKKIKALSSLSQDELEEYIYIDTLISRIKSHQFLPIIFCIWNYCIQVHLERYTGYSSSSYGTKILAFIPKFIIKDDKDAAINLHKTTLNEISAVMECSYCKKVFILNSSIKAYVTGNTDYCEICSAGSSNGEKSINKLFRNDIFTAPGIHVTSFKRQETLPDSDLRLDFLLELKVNSTGKTGAYCIEYDGDYHNTSIESIHSDLEKTNLCIQCGIKIIRFRTKAFIKKRLELLKTSPYKDDLKYIDDNSRIIDYTDTIDKIFVGHSGSLRGYPKYTEDFKNDQKRKEYILNFLKQ